MAPENEFKKTWTKPILDGEAAGLILRLEPTDKKKILRRVLRYIWLPMVERHPVQKFKLM